MGTYVYYCEVRINQEDIKSGVYSIEAVENPATRWFPRLQSMIRMSERVWKQGPKGGVKIIKYPWSQHWPMGYITQNEKYIKEFAWIKIQAKEIRG